ncbi:Hpt domain-containing protein [Pseudobacteriovorax antillogorgiicola]|uniref:Hpt domain-containing protein n=1 Tax=Pseudobacteriovorax antillogorgiicola TaxID=1513793 RepID=A0A1Y6C254_9BACT|nr:Hpt domain-containing protein [Pseudobacteriovorax antillogorgiicola]TCS51157.1 Hpt domain-containing protein [Pseudobacteriovorax antillogorgiicola]SMF38159.1 Hpt domain-containing protein [Pseudobacteriovorax antillogorgiicola]
MLIEVDKELEDVFPVYIRNRQEDLMNLEISLERKDFDVLKQIGHKVAGNAAGYGLQDLGKFAKDLESSAADKKLDECQKLVVQMKDYIKGLELKFV